MPYISQDERPQYEEALNQIDGRLIEREYKPGDVTYVYYSIAMREKRDVEARQFVKLRATTIGGIGMRPTASFAERTRILANLRAAADEFKRRHVDPYEDEKGRIHGDIL
jgi:hypothetical protein